MNKFDLVVFDMAGTTVADNGEVTRAFMAALAEFDIAITPEELNKVRGASKREALLMLLGSLRASQLDAIYARFVETLSAIYRDNGAHEAPGAMGAFEFFKDRGLKIALNTGFERSIVEVLLLALGWRRFMFDAIICGDEVMRGRPAPDLILHAMKVADVSDVSRVINVGDTLLDLQAGARACVGANVGVWSGAHSREQLLTGPHSHVVASVRDLPELMTASD